MKSNYYLRCTWNEYRIANGRSTCPYDAETCAVYGCLEGHISEFICCEYHFDIWVDMVADDAALCPIRHCARKIDSWERTPVRELTSGFALYMETRQ